MNKSFKIATSMIFTFVLLCTTALVLSADENNSYLGLGTSFSYTESNQIGTFYDSDGKEVESGILTGVTCDLYYDENNDGTYSELIGTKTTDGEVDPDLISSNPFISPDMEDIVFTGLEIGTYRFECHGYPEGTYNNFYEGYIAPDGWELGDDYFLPGEIYADDTGMGSFIQFKPSYQDLNILKVDSVTGEPIAGTEFELRQDSNGDGSYDVLVDTYTTDSDGLISLDNIIYGDYELVEVNATVGYINDESSYEFSSDYNLTQNQYVYGDEDTPFIIENDPVVGYIELTKVGIFDSYNLPLENVTFDIYEDLNSNGLIDSGEVVIDIITTDDDGYGLSDGLLMGDYIVVESGAPDGIVLDEDTMYSVSINSTDIVKLNDGQSIFNILLDSDSDNVPDVIDLCSDTNNDIDVDEDGCEVTKEGEITDSNDSEDNASTDEEENEIQDTGFSTYGYEIMMILILFIIIIVVKKYNKTK